MAIESEAATIKHRMEIEGEWLELIFAMRDSAPKVAAPKMAELAEATLGAWLRAWRAVKHQKWETDSEVPETKLGIPAREDGEPRVTIYNHTFEAGKLSLTIQSHANGAGAIEMAHGQLLLIDSIKAKKPQLFSGSSQQAQAPQAAPKQANSPDKEDIDAWLKNTSDSKAQTAHGGNGQAVATATKEAVAVASNLPFRRFKSLADGIIQVQEFKQGGGGDKYQKSAIKASLPYNKTEVQYEDDSLIYYPITGAIQVVEGQYGIQALIPTEKGRVYVSMKNAQDEETPDWHNFAQDLGDNYIEVMNQEEPKLLAPNCLLVLKTGKTKDGKQYKNFYHLYQPLVEAVKA